MPQAATHPPYKTRPKVDAVGCGAAGRLPRPRRRGQRRRGQRRRDAAVRLAQAAASIAHPAAALAQAAAALVQAAARLTQAAAPPLAPAATPLAHPARHVLCYAARAAPITRCRTRILARSGSPSAACSSTASLATPLEAHGRCPASCNGGGGGVRLPSGPACGHFASGASTGALIACRASNSPMPMHCSRTDSACPFHCFRLLSRGDLRVRRPSAVVSMRAYTATLGNVRHTCCGGRVARQPRASGRNRLANETLVRPHTGPGGLM